MHKQYSMYLAQIKAKIIELERLLQQKFTYVSILATDVNGISVRVGQKQKSISDYMLSERGFVIRVYQDGLYSEYSFNVLDVDNIEVLADKVIKKFNDHYRFIKELALTIYQTPMINEEKAEMFTEKEVAIMPSAIPIATVVDTLSKISDKGYEYDERIFEFQVSLSMINVSKLFISSSKQLAQSYIFSEAAMAALARDNEQVKMDYRVLSGLKGAEILDELNLKIDETASSTMALFAAERVEPGLYDVICTPEVAGLIAHEAFGHGVEMDMFVKNRSLAKSHLNHKIAADNVSMHDGALCAENTSSYLFDDEGVLAQDTKIIANGILENGICDTLSALRLNVQPTGNGKRQSFERKAYTRMTNTIFMAGDDELADMIASIKHGYLLEGVQSGMEDPKNWGIQCMLTKGREIVDGVFTGKIVNPVIMTGYVPELLCSISMIGKDVAVYGSGYCGKGYKEYVKAVDGGPYIKAKARLG